MSEPEPVETPPPPTPKRERAPAWHTTDVLRTAALIIGMYILVRLVWFAHPLLLAAFLGVLFGLAVSAGVDRLVPVGIPRAVGAGLVVATFFALLIGFGAWVAPTLRAQGIELRRQLPEALDRLELWIDQRRGGFIGLVFGGLSTEARFDSAATARPRGAAPVSVAPKPGDS